MEAEKRAVGALRLLSWLQARPGQKEGGHCLTAAGPGTEPPRPQERWAPRARRPLRAHTCAFLDAAAPPLPTVCCSPAGQGPCAFVGSRVWI